MYLSMLSKENKHLFLNLELFMSEIDGSFSEEEKQIIDTHCMEMHIDNNDYRTEGTLDELLVQVGRSFSYTEMRIAFLELFATVLADNVYHDKEKVLVERLADLFCISNEDVEAARNTIMNLKSEYNWCSQFIKEK